MSIFITDMQECLECSLPNVAINFDDTDRVDSSGWHCKLRLFVIIKKMITVSAWVGIFKKFAALGSPYGYRGFEFIGSSSDRIRFRDGSGLGGIFRRHLGAELG